MIRKLAFLAACTSLLAVAKAPERSLQVVTTETVDFNGGTLHLNSTYGELNVETWDEPRIEITLTRTAFRHAASSDQESGKAFLNRIKLTVQKAANGDVTVSTQFPGRNRLVRAVWGLGDFNLDYRIKVPRTANLKIQHGVGDVMVAGVKGNVEASVKSGDLVVQLADPDKTAISARCDVGDIYTDFDGTHRSPYLVGQKFTGGAGHTVDLHVAVGGISIQRIG